MPSYDRLFIGGGWVPPSTTSTIEVRNASTGETIASVAEAAEADFQDPLEMKIVTLDLMCRQQQAAEGWFPTWQEAPERAPLPEPAAAR